MSSIIICILLLSIGMAEKYQFDVGSYTVKFNSSQDLVILSPLPHEESGSHAGGWDITLLDNMSHDIADITIIEEESTMPLSNELIDRLLDNNLARLSGTKSKSTIRLNGVDGRIAEGSSPQSGMIYKQIIAPFNPSYDSFFKRIATKGFIIFSGYDLPVFDQIVDSLNITKNQ